MVRRIAITVFCGVLVAGAWAAKKTAKVAPVPFDYFVLTLS